MTYYAARLDLVNPLVLIPEGTGRIEPIAAHYKRDWFAAARAEEPIAGLVSRHRFVVRVTRPAVPRAGILHVRWPDDAELNARGFVPLARVARGGVEGVVTGAADVARLAEWCARLRGDEARFDEPLPRALLDACRFGARRCVAERGAAGAILDDGGGVRPCTRGAVVARAEHTLAQLTAKLAALDEEARVRRGCSLCPARDACSQCLFPVFLDEAAYCDFIRAYAPDLPRLHRLFDTIARLDELGAPIGPLTIRRHPDDTWHVTRGEFSTTFRP